MEELTVLAEIEHTESLKAIPSAFQPGIWRYCLYAAGGVLPFMEDTFNRAKIKASNIIIDNEEYARADTLEELRARLPVKDGGWVNRGSVVYVKFPHFRPPVVFFKYRHGVLEGFTNSSPVMLDGLMYRPGLLTAPVTENSADAFTYDKMKFNSASISFANTDARFDKAGFLFGNEFNLRAGTAENRQDAQPRNIVKMIESAGGVKTVSMQKKTGEYVTLIDGEEKQQPSPADYPMLAQYYISNMTVSLDKATFHLKDKRERLSAKIPDKQFTAETLGKDFEYLDDDVKDTDMQEAYGHCFGVPGVCLEGKRVYVNKDAANKTVLPQYRFRFSSEITRIDRIQVKMTAGDVRDPDGPPGSTIRVDGWTTVYQREPPEDANSLDLWPGDWPADGSGRWKPGLETGDPEPPGDLETYKNRGIITLRWDIAKEGGRRENSANETRIDGVFINKTTPLEIIPDIMAKYSGFPYAPGKYNIEEIEQELAPLSHEIGIMFDKPVSVYEAIEKIQGGCVLGFQFCVRENKFTARLDNPNRPEKPEIKAAEILNLDEVEVDWNADLYGTHADIEYAYNYGEQAGRHFIDTDMREAILDLHRVEKEWPASSLLANEESAEKKSNILLEDFAEMCPLIKNIKLSGRKWLALRVYDILPIDFSIHREEQANYAGRIIRLMEGAGRTVSLRKKTGEYVTSIGEEKEVSGGRDFAGKKVRCQILRVEFDTQSGITTIDVRKRERSKEWAA